MDKDEYNDIYQLDMHDEWLNSAYDEDGNSVQCDICGCDMKWSPEARLWFCPDCEQTIEREQSILITSEPNLRVLIASPIA